MDKIVLRRDWDESKRDEVYGMLANTLVEIAREYAGSRGISVEELAGRIECHHPEQVLALLQGKEAYPAGNDLERVMAKLEAYHSFMEGAPVTVAVTRTPPTPGWSEDDRETRSSLELTNWMFFEATRRYLKAFPEEEKKAKEEIDAMRR